ncbi:MAG: extracellular solute-binding protein [Clostridia bacterium]|nr:extracellular solute-binding protein [Clostridia bacterium]
MKKTTVIKIASIALAAVIVAVIVIAVLSSVRKIGEVDNNLPDFPETPSLGNSWDYWEDERYDDGDIVELDWYVNASTFRWSGNGGTDVSNKILEKTGVKINFEIPVKDDGEKLTTMIAANKLPDLVTVTVNDLTRIKLAEEGYVYSITDMAKKWAPNFIGSYSEEIQKYFAATDGKLYGMPHLYYTQEDMEDYAKQGGYLLPNTVFCARKDILDWYESNYPDADPTSPDGFFEMCRIVRNDCPLYTTASNFSTVQLASFSATEENESVTRLAQYFSYRKETADGNLKYMQADERYEEALLYLNRLYNAGLISSSDFTDTKAAVGQNISNGRPFATFVTPQNYQQYFYEWNRKNQDKEYVPIVFTNKDGDAPLLTDLAGTGYLFSMVSTNCKRPDRVMKLLDYLSSYEGQMLMLYGIEGKTYKYSVRPGETVDGQTYKYGKVEWYDEDVASTVYKGRSVVTWGFDFEILTNRMLDHMVNPTGISLRNLSSFILYNQKAPLIPYTYNPMRSAFIRDTQDKNYRDIVNKDVACKNLWIERASTIISASSADKCKELYEKTLSLAETKGYKDVLAFDNRCFKEYKEKMGYAYTIPTLAPDYVKPEIRFRGFEEYLIEIPQAAWDAVG